MAACLLSFYAIVINAKHQTAKCWRGYAETDESWLVMGPNIVSLVVSYTLRITRFRLFFMFKYLKTSLKFFS